MNGKKNTKNILFQRKRKETTAKNATTKEQGQLKQFTRHLEKSVDSTSATHILLVNPQPVGSA